MGGLYKLIGVIVNIIKEVIIVMIKVFKI